MPTQKIEYSAVDAQPTVLYAKSVSTSQLAYPVVAAGGALTVTSGFNIPAYDYIDFTSLANIQFKLGGVNGTLVATVNLTGTIIART